MPKLYEDVRDAGPFVFVAGQTPQAASGDIPDEMAAQVGVVMDKIAELLAARELALSDIVKVTYFLTDIGDLAEVRAALDALLPHPRPTSTLVAVAGLVDPRFRIEIEAIAYRK